MAAHRHLYGVLFPILLLATPSRASDARVVVAEATYVMGDSDTLAGAEEQVLLRAKRKAVEEAGVYIEATSKDVETQAGGKTTHWNHLGIRTIASAVTQTEVLDKHRSLDGDRVTFYVKIRATIHLHTLAEAIKRLKSDEQLAEHFEQLQAENSELRSQIDRLRKQLEEQLPSTPDPAKARKNRQAATKLVSTAVRSHSLSEKIDLASQAIEADPAFGDAFVVRGQTYLKIASLTLSKNDLRPAPNHLVEQARADFERALALDPGSTWALLGRGDARTWQSQHQAAAQDYERILELDPLFDLARQRLIALYTMLAKKQVAAREWRQALMTLNRLLRGTPVKSWIVHEKEAYLLRSRVQVELGNLEPAIEDLSTVLQVFPGELEALVSRGHLYRRLLQGRLAKEDYGRACTLGSSEGCAALR